MQLNKKFLQDFIHAAKLTTFRREWNWVLSSFCLSSSSLSLALCSSRVAYWVCEWFSRSPQSQLWEGLPVVGTLKLLPHPDTPSKMRASNWARV